MGKELSFGEGELAEIGLEVRDVFLGVSGQIPDGWIVASDLDTLTAHDPKAPLAIVFASRLDPDTLSRKLLNLVQNMLGAPLLNVRAIRGEFLEIRADLPPAQGLQLLGLPPGQLIVRIRPGQPAKGWIAHQSLLTPELEEISSTFRPIETVRARPLRIVDPARRMTAFNAVVPASATVEQSLQNESPHLDVRGKGYRIVVYPPQNFVHGDPFTAQAYLAVGYRPQPYMDARDYASSVLSSMGYGTTRVEGAPVPGILSHEVYAAMGRSLASGMPPMISSAIAWFDGGVAWVVTIGETFMGVQLWRAYLYLAIGEDALGILQSTVMHTSADVRWLNTLSRESNAMYRSLRSSMRSFRVPKVDLGPYTPQGQEVGDEWGSGDDWAGGSGDEDYSPDSTWLSDETSTGTGMDTFYVDSDGSVRNMDLGEEVSFHEIDSEGILRGEEGNEVGYVDDGYVYDSEGNRMGWLDTFISDEWQMERLESESSDPADVFGYYDWGAQENEESTETPYYSKRDEEEE